MSSLLTLAQKKKYVKDQMKAVTDKVIQAVETMPPEWDGVELQAFIAQQFQDPDVEYALRGNTARGRAFNAVLASRSL
jgi:hypothetical protein